MRTLANAFAATATTGSLIQFLQTQGYVIMFFIMIVEGTFVTFVSAFMASLGIFNVYIVFGLSVLGNFLADIAAYFIGRHWGKKVITKYFSNKLKGEKMKKLDSFIAKRPGRTIALVKISPVIPIPGLMFIGASNVPLKTFVFYALITGAAYSFVFTALGFYSGVAFNSVAKYVHHSEIFIGAAIILGLGLWFIVRFISKRITKEKGI